MNRSNGRLASVTSSFVKKTIEHAPEVLDKSNKVVVALAKKVGEMPATIAPKPKFWQTPWFLALATGVTGITGFLAGKATFSRSGRGH